MVELIPTRRVVVEWTVLGTVLTLVASFIFSGVYAAGTGQTDVGFQISDFESALVEVTGVIVLIVAVLGLHETVHAGVIRHFGGDVSIGVGIAQFVLPYAYVTTTQRLKRNQFIVVALAPLVVITVLGVPLMIMLDAAILILPLALNVGGAIGDLWMAGILLRYPTHVVVEDSVTGVTIYGRPDDELAATSESGLLRRAIIGTAGGFGLLLLVGLSAPILVGALGVDAVTIGLPGSPWSIYTFEGSAGEFDMNLNYVGLVGASVLIGCLFSIGAHFLRG
ncbi:hypothetical protein C2R22_21025 (plasmid) [Salinigranum rubrum]|uniref:DUF3267 domain-containing protein n=1 Tax=Salinigranum rubrum TaxID=755307 RepID=A0A2I8VSV1_9EURY|nr:hypothetical protein C2R22_21025 [Salinigranum rubrum]